jgi:hypothetical protein
VRRLLRFSAVLTLIALLLMLWSMFDPTPLPVMIAMTAGQGIGTLAFGLYLFVIVQDLRKYKRVESTERSSLTDIPVSSEKPSGPPP